MENNIEVDSFYRVPVGNLTSDYRKLVASLTFPNPEYKAQGFSGGGFSYGKTVPKNITFYGLDEDNRQILLPRNISKDYFIYNNIIYNNISKGVSIGDGRSVTLRLRDYQEEFFEEEVYPHLRENEAEGFLDILLDCECGSGKTIMALWIAALYEVSTIVCVTKRPIGEQFIAAVKELFPHWSVGWYEKGCSYDITVATYALLSGDDYDSKFFDRYGHIVMDEYHRVGASTYSTILNKARCKYRTTLTATFRRKDGLHKALAVHVGKQLHMKRRAKKAVIQPLTTKADINPILYKQVQKKYIKMPSKAMYSDVCVKNSKRKEIDRGMVVECTDPIYANGHKTKDGSVTIDSAVYGGKMTYVMPENGIMLLGNLSVAAIDSEIASNEMRNSQVFDLVRKLHRRGRRVLILSKRKEQLFKLHKKSIRRGLPSGLIVSAKDKEYNKYAKHLGHKNGEEYANWVLCNAKIIYGIDKLAEEGLDIPSFDTIVYLNPIKDIEQSIGRITRDYQDKQDPLALMLVDDIQVYRNMVFGNKGAMKMFKELEHTVNKELTIEQYLMN
jgi:superfamily II DNA or RNA helicase